MMVIHRDIHNGISFLPYLVIEFPVETTSRGCENGFRTLSYNFGSVVHLLDLLGNPFYDGGMTRRRILVGLAPMWFLFGHKIIANPAGWTPSLHSPSKGPCWVEIHWYTWLVVTGTWILFFHILGRIIPVDKYVSEELKPPITNQIRYN